MLTYVLKVEHALQELDTGTVRNIPLTDTNIKPVYERLIKRLNKMSPRVRSIMQQSVYALARYVVTPSVTLPYH